MLTAERAADNPDGSLPKDLTDFRGRLPDRFDCETIAAEKRTYYWYLRYVYNLYA